MGLEDIGKEATSAAPLPSSSTLNSRLVGGLMSRLANNSNQPSNNNAAAAALRKACAPVVEARKPVVKLVNKVLSFSKVLNEIVGLTVDTKVSPLLMKRKTDELARAEGNIRFIRRVSKATGLE